MGMFEPLTQLVKEKFGTKGLVALSAFCLGALVITQYGNYVVTPDSLDKKLLPLDVNINLTQLGLIRFEHSSLTKEMYDLQDKMDASIDGHGVRQRDKDRLETVKSRLQELGENEKELLAAVKEKTELE